MTWLHASFSPEEVCWFTSWQWEWSQHKAEWLTLIPHSKKVEGLIPRYDRPSCVELVCSLCVWEGFPWFPPTIREHTQGTIAKKNQTEITACSQVSGGARAHGWFFLPVCFGCKMRPGSVVKCVIFILWQDRNPCLFCFTVYQQLKVNLVKLFVLLLCSTLNSTEEGTFSQHVQTSGRLVSSQLSHHLRSFYLFKNSIQAPWVHRIRKISSDLLPDFLYNSDPGNLCGILRGTTFFPRELALHPLHINPTQPLHTRFFFQDLIQIIPS